MRTGSTVTGPDYLGGPLSNVAVPIAKTPRCSEQTLDIEPQTCQTAAVRSTVLVVQNDPDKPLGAIADALVGAGVRLDVRSPDHDLPPVDRYGGLIVLPGLANPVDEHAAVQRARGAIHAALELELPTLGICLGGQLLVQALGGRVYPCKPELGFGEVFASPAAFTDPLLLGAPERFSVFHAHTFAFEAPTDADVLLTNDASTQACRNGEAWAFQCHPEISREWVARLAAGLRGQDGGLPPGTTDFFVRNRVSPEDLERDARLAQAAVSRVAAGIADGFASRVT
jgi:GMP synthase (glutamine-hydrolysing)